MKFTEQLDGKKRKDYDQKLYEVPYLICAINEIFTKVKKLPIPDIYIDDGKDFNPWAESLLRWMNVLFPLEFATQMLHELANNEAKRERMFSEEFTNYIGTVYKMGGRSAVEEALYKNLELEKGWIEDEIDYSEFKYPEAQ